VAAYGCLKALNTLLDGVAEMKHLLPVLEEVLFPIMAKCLSTDGQDVLEDVLELLAYFTYFGGEQQTLWWAMLMLFALGLAGLANMLAFGCYAEVLRNDHHSKP
jgi:hypothetical protein